jgi:hypothetical protein
MHRFLLSIVLFSFVCGCERSQSDSVTCEVPLPPPGSNEVLRSKVRVADNLEVIISNVCDAYVIPPEAIHAPYGGPDGGHAIVFRLHVEGKEERYLVP